MWPSTKTGEAEKLPPTRFFQIVSPVLASTHDATPSELTMNSKSSIKSGEGREGIALVIFQATLLSDSSPGPSGRTATSSGFS